MNDALRRGLEQLAERGTARGAADVIDHARASLHRRHMRTRRLVAVGAVTLVVVCAGAVVVLLDDDRGSEVVTQPTVVPGDARPEVVGDPSPDATLAYELRLDDGSAVAVELPTTYELMEGPIVTPHPGGGGATTRWTFGSPVEHATLSVSVAEGADALWPLLVLDQVDGVLREGAQVFVNEMEGIPPKSIGWSPQAGTVVWLGTNSLSRDELVAVSESVRYRP